jgi:hypothetical protein
MTPKEKASELVGRYRKEILRGKYRIDGFVIEELAEECTLIAVDEILNSNPQPYIANDESKELLLFPDYTHVDAVKFWQQVKQIIEAL